MRKLQKKVSVPTLLSDSVKTVCERIDTFLEETSYHCFGNFTNIHERLLTLSDMRSLITMLKQSLPEIWDHYMAFLGYTERMRRDKRNERRLPQYEKNVFFSDSSLIVGSPTASYLSSLQSSCRHLLLFAVGR
jgi:hypothetical protein